MTWPVLLLLVGGWILLIGLLTTAINLARWWYSR